MGRWWDEFVAVVDDMVGLGVTVLLLFLAAALVAAGWYFWPRWLPRHWPSRAAGADRAGRRWRWPRLRRPRFRWRWPWRRRRAAAPTEPDVVPHETDGLPELPVAAFLSLADRLAAEGRYAEAVRERLRGIVRELVDAGVVENRPGFTVTELASAAAAARPPVRPPLDGASRLFSDIWYGQRPAGAGHDARMRGYAAAVHAALQPLGVAA
jgi:Domain of unknown function (DUF4129)